MSDTREELTKRDIIEREQIVAEYKCAGILDCKFLKSICDDENK